MLTINLDKLDLKPGDRVLDLGCGEGRHSIGTLYSHPEVKIIAIDLSFKDLTVAKNRHSDFDNTSSKNCLYTQADGCQLPFLDNSFDHIICSEVLEHIPHYRHMLKEIERLLKPGGLFSVSVPRYWPEKICWALSTEYHQVEGGHIRIFNSRSLKNEVLQGRFTYQSKHWAHALHVPYWWLRCAFWSRGDKFFLVKIYHQLLVWDLMKRPALTRTIELLLNPILGKSIVMYFEKQMGDEQKGQQT
ncbi:MAG: methyltransferase domain-containing protein [Agarilytica sp.]